MSADPKYRTECTTCGEKSPRPVTSWTLTNWMRKHDAKHQESGE
jgi:hypothetical protein